MRWVLRWLFNLALWIDQGANTILGGDPRETLSSRMGKARERCPVCYWVCRALHVLDPRHCRESVDKDVGDRALWRW